MSLFDFRDAFQDYCEVPSSLVFEAGPGSNRPVTLTIAIPTFRRPELLKEAIESALAQETNREFEVIVADNDSESKSFEEIRNFLPKNPRVKFRYYVNDHNIGMFGNWNRCIELATGTWVTILNDDDLLRNNFFERAFHVIDGKKSIEGLVPKKDLFYRGMAPAKPAKFLLLLQARSYLRSKLRFDKDGLCRVKPEALFFGNELGNGAGFVFKKSTAIRLGGYRQEDFPSSDFFFFLRMSVEGTLYHFKEVLADVGIGVNESLSLDTVLGFIYQGPQVRGALAGKYVPSGWSRLDKQLMSNTIREFGNQFSVEIDRARIEHDFNCVLPKPNHRRIIMFRSLRGIF